MKNYQAPLEDMLFCLNEISHPDLDAAEADEAHRIILDQAAQFSAEVLAPIDRDCDEHGCRFEAGKVTLPPALRAAYQRYAAGGWMGLAMPEAWGGQALSNRLGAFTGEMLTSSHHAFSMIPALNMSAIRALLKFGSDALQKTYLEKMISGQWLGCMSLTEPHCGSDLGLIQTQATATDDGYCIEGNKIFISAGEHDAVDNIIHLVLARVKGAPAGIKGLSLFLVPRVLPDTGEFNRVHCTGLEEKMGIHANPTCSIHYDQSRGFLVGELHQGIKAMFIMMNEMRMGTALQGVGLSETSYQSSLNYAQERRQGRSLRGPVDTEQAADTLLVHADVRRMILTQRAFAEGGRALSQYCAQLLDCTEACDAAIDETSQKRYRQLLGFLTPIAKAFCTETGLESASLAIQVLGGHGFIRDSGVEQLYRDGRISTLYEGTTGIQGLDLLGRKVLGSQGQSLMLFTRQIHTLCKKHQDHPTLSGLVSQLADYAQEWPALTQKIGLKAMQDHEEVSAAAVDYLMYSGYVTLAYFWLEMALTAESAAAGERYAGSFLKQKQRTARFYFARLLPRAQAHKTALEAGEAVLAL